MEITPRRQRALAKLKEAREHRAVLQQLNQSVSTPASIITGGSVVEVIDTTKVHLIKQTPPTAAALANPKRAPIPLPTPKLSAGAVAIPTVLQALANPKKKVLPVLRPKACLYLGKLIERVGCGSCRRSDIRQCDFKEFEGKHVTQNKDCETCTKYEEE